MQIFAMLSGDFPLKLILGECQGYQVNIGSGYGLVPSGNKP